MTDAQFEVGGLVVPDALLHAIDAGCWSPPADAEVILSVFGELPSYPSFYNRAAMIRQNKAFQLKSPHQTDSPADADPGILPSQAVLIGDLGMDMPIALDYRLDAAEPRVLYLAEPGWIVVAPNVTALLESLGIEVGSPEE